MKELQVICHEGDEQFRDEVIAYINEKYQSQAVIIPGVLKRTK